MFEDPPEYIVSTVGYTQEQLDAAVEAMRIETLEKAAKVCEEKADGYGAINDEWGNQQRITANLCAAAIRGMK